jgi:LytTr DNA-binding domain
MGARVVLVPVGEVEWIESDGDCARIHAAGASHLVSVRMHVLEEMLDPRRFLRVHRSVILSLARVSELRRDAEGGGSLGRGISAYEYSRGTGRSNDLTVAVSRPFSRLSASSKKVTSPRVEDMRRKRDCGRVREG